MISPTHVGHCRTTFLPLPSHQQDHADKDFRSSFFSRGYFGSSVSSMQIRALAISSCAIIVTELVETEASIDSKSGQVVSTLLVTMLEL